MIAAIPSHAVDAWRTRVDPGLSTQEAGQQVMAFLADAIEVDRPRWAYRGAEAPEDAIYATNRKWPDVCVVLGSRSYGLAALTVLTKDEGIRIRRDFKDTLREMQLRRREVERFSRRLRRRALNREAS